MLKRGGVVCPAYLPIFRGWFSVLTISRSHNKTVCPKNRKSKSTTSVFLDGVRAPHLCVTVFTWAGLQDCLMSDGYKLCTLNHQIPYLLTTIIQAKQTKKRVWQCRVLSCRRKYMLPRCDRSQKSMSSLKNLSWRTQGRNSKETISVVYFDDIRFSSILWHVLEFKVLRDIASNSADQ